MDGMARDLQHDVRRLVWRSLAFVVLVPALGAGVGATERENGVSESPAGLSALELIVDLPADEVLSYEVRLDADGSITWIREGSDGADATMRRCVDPDRAALVQDWLERGRVLGEALDLVPDDEATAPDVLALFNEGETRYWLTFERLDDHGVPGSWDPAAAADYRRVRTFARELWMALEPHRPDFERDCEPVELL
jgi:hypothetical protein